MEELGEPLPWPLAAKAWLYAEAPVGEWEEYEDADWHIAATYRPDLRHNPCTVCFSSADVQYLMEALPGAFAEWEDLKTQLGSVSYEPETDSTLCTIYVNGTWDGIRLHEDMRWPNTVTIKDREQLVGVMEALARSQERGPELLALARNLAEKKKAKAAAAALRLSEEAVRLAQERAAQDAVLAAAQAQAQAEERAAAAATAAQRQRAERERREERAQRLVPVVAAMTCAVALMALVAAVLLAT